MAVAVVLRVVAVVHVFGPAVRFGMMGRDAGFLGLGVLAAMLVAHSPFVIGMPLGLAFSLGGRFGSLRFFSARARPAMQIHEHPRAARARLSILAFRPIASFFAVPRHAFPRLMLSMFSTIRLPAFAAFDLPGFAFPTSKRSTISTIRLPAFPVFERTRLARLADRPFLALGPARSATKLSFAMPARLAGARRSLCRVALRFDSARHGDRDFRRPESAPAAKRGAWPVFGSLLVGFRRDFLGARLVGIAGLDVRRPRTLAATRRFVRAIVVAVAPVGVRG
ncbi:MAG TPA: hypothetical protein VHR72_10305, partial [Gemmataceae bacterium]|nr:hypothetical protein [Gemmataceae bacterium]